MNWREFIATAWGQLGAVLRDDRSARMAALTGLAILFLASIATVLVTRLRARAQRRDAALHPAREADDLGDWSFGSGAAGSSPGGSHWPIDRVLPRRISGTIFLAAGVAIAVWLAGLALAPSIPTFLAAEEWHFQPFYIAAHIIAVRLFVLAYTRGFERGVAHLAMPESEAHTLIDRVLGFSGALVALVISLPFVALDFLYLFSSRYERMGGPDTVLPIDYLMWCVWSVEWFLNAFIWVVLLGFLVKTSWVIKRHPFRAPIEIVLHDRQYRPFLQMSAHGASIVLAFTIVTVLYIWYTGGELTDYVGLCITATLLVASFVPSWLLLKAKVHRAVEDETLAMRRRLLRNLELAEAEASAALVHGHGSGLGEARSLEHRLDAAVSILRISYLETRHMNLGATEARAVLLRMLAPAASVGWQVAKSHGALVSEVQGYFARFF